MNKLKIKMYTEIYLRDVFVLKAQLISLIQLPFTQSSGEFENYLIYILSSFHDRCHHLAVSFITAQSIYFHNNSWRVTKQKVQTKQIFRTKQYRQNAIFCFNSSWKIFHYNIYAIKICTNHLSMFVNCVIKLRCKNIK